MSCTLRAFFENVYRPIKLGPSRLDYVSQYRSAIHWFADAIGREPTVGDLTVDNLRLLLTRLEVVRLDRRRTIRSRIGSLWLYANTLGMGAPYRKIPTQPKPPSNVVQPEPGTVWHLFETSYRPTRMVGCAISTVKEYRFTFRLMREHFERDLRIDEQTDGIAAEHLEWLLAKEYLPVTVNGYRGCWFTVWRHAVEKHLIDRPPCVRKLRVDLDEPDAWDDVEGSRIIEATAVLRDWRPIAGVFLADKFFRALLLVGYWAALRRGSLLKLKRSDISIETGWLSVGGNQMKNRRGRKYLMAPDAIDAVRQIWLPDRELLFPFPHTDKYLYRCINELLRVAEVAPSTRRSMTKLHKWRRTAGTQAAVHGGLEAAICLLNHSGPDVTKRYIDPTKLPGRDMTKILPSLTGARAFSQTR